MIIQSIKLKGKNANIFVVTTDEGQYLLHSDIIVKFGLHMGEFDAEKFKLAEEESNVLIATNVALKLLNQHMKTEKQVKDYLYKKEYKSKTVNAVINKLKEYNILNDNNFAQSYIRSNPSFSKRKLKQKLQSFGIKEQDYSEDLCEIDELPACVHEVEKFLKNKLPSKENTEKLTRRLVGQGYGWDTIKQAMKNLIEED